MRLTEDKSRIIREIERHRLESSSNQWRFHPHTEDFSQKQPEQSDAVFDEIQSRCAQELPRLTSRLHPSRY